MVYPYPRARENIGELAFRELRDSSASDLTTLNKKITKMREVTSYRTSDFISYSKEAFDLLDSFKSDNIARVYPHHLFCDNSKCEFLSDIALYVVDANHPSSYFAAEFSKLIKAEIDRKRW